MWRRLVSSHLKTLATAAPAAPRSAVVTARPLAERWNGFPSVLCRLYGAESASVKRVEDVMPIATGHEREEFEAVLEGRDILDINHPASPFGTKESPAVIKSYYDMRIVGCPGGEGKHKHKYPFWFGLEKGTPYECPVCSQYFVLEVVGPGGPPPPSFVLISSPSWLWDGEEDDSDEEEDEEEDDLLQGSTSLRPIPAAS